MVSKKKNMPSEVKELDKTEESLLEDMSDQVSLFHTPDGEGYGIISVNGHRETWALGSAGFCNWLNFRSFQKCGEPLSPKALKKTISCLMARAQFSSPECPIFTRVGSYNGLIYLDLCNETWEAIEISTSGWQVVADPPVRFIRVQGMRPLPHPVKGAKVAELQQFTNTPDNNTWVPCLSWLVGAMKPTGPYPILNIISGPARGKSTTVRLLRDLIDPSTAPLRSTPSSIRDLMIASKNSWVLAYDNLSEMPGWLSDGFCRLATGAGFSTRKLYSDGDEFIIRSSRPVIFNGIDYLPDREDFMDRSMVIHLPQIPNQKRVSEEKLWREFEMARPRILGAVLDAVSSALSNSNKIELDSHPRMADFTRWIVAAEDTIGWPSGTFLEVYDSNRQQIVEESIERNQVAWAVRALSKEKKSWKGTATDLLKKLEEFVPETERRAGFWPKSPSQLSGKLRRAENDLLSTGVKIIFDLREGGTGTRFIMINPNPNE